MSAQYRLLWFLILLIHLIVAPSQAATSYYVATTGKDGSQIAGTLTAPWKTLGYALTRVHAGDSIYLRGGTYTNIMANFVLVQGNAELPITITKYAAETPIIANILLRGGSHHVRIVGLQFDGTLGNFEDCIKVENTDYYSNGQGYSDHIEILGNSIKHCSRQGILIGGEDHKIIGNMISNNGTHQRGDHGLYAWGRRFTVSENIIHDNTAHGIQFYPGVADSVISHNTIVANGANGIILGGGTGDNLDYGSNTPRSSNNNLVVDNIIAYQRSNYIYSDIGCAVSTEDGLASNNILRSNVVYANISGDLTCAGQMFGIQVEQSNKVLDPQFVTPGPASPDVHCLSTDSSGYCVVPNPPDVMRDLHLKSLSPAISTASTNINHDADGQGQSGLPDIGALEYIDDVLLPDQPKNVRLQGE